MTESKDLKVTKIYRWNKQAEVGKNENGPFSRPKLIAACSAD
jgi:hypothetical protein